MLKSRGSFWAGLPGDDRGYLWALTSFTSRSRSKTFRKGLPMSSYPWSIHVFSSLTCHATAAARYDEKGDNNIPPFPVHYNFLDCFCLCTVFYWRFPETFVGRDLHPLVCLGADYCWVVCHVHGLGYECCSLFTSGLGGEAQVRNPEMSRHRCRRHKRRAHRRWDGLGWRAVILPEGMGVFSSFMEGHS